MARRGRSFILALALGFHLALSFHAAFAADAAALIATLTPDNAARLAPGGRESDWIYGDVVLRNEQLTAVIARPVPGRNANWALREVGCALIDFVRTDDPKDALGLFRPGGSAVAYGPSPAQKLDLPAGANGSEFRCVSTPAAGQPEITLVYRLKPDHLEIDTLYTNLSSAPIELSPRDELIAEAPFEKRGDATGRGSGRFFWVYDRFAGQAFGLSADDTVLRFVSDARRTELRHELAGDSTLPAGSSRRVVRRLFVAPDEIALRASFERASGNPVHELRLTITDPKGPVAAADVTLFDSHGVRFASGRSGAMGVQALPLATGRYTARISAPGRGSRDLAFAASGAGDLAMTLPLPAVLEARVIDGLGDGIPAKIQFLGMADTPTPDFGPEQGEHALRNAVYTHDGSLQRELEPGRYHLVVSHGPEYDAVQTVVELAPGEIRREEIRLRRSVDTRAWISVDLDTHTTESGDTRASQRGRVLNLLAEQIEFAPASEHNRVSDYSPQLEALRAGRFMASSPGVELTGTLATNRQIAFPLTLHARTQDGGAPLPADSATQIRRLRLHDDSSEKLVALKVTDLWQILDNRDEVSPPPIEEVDAVEISPLERFLTEENAETHDSPMRHWLALLNRGLRVPALISSDAHSNFHGAGARRTWVRSKTDYPGALEALEIARALKRGRAVMSTGPFLEVTMQAGKESDAPIAIPGDDLVAPGREVELTIRVQCPNWLDIDRVQVLLNGRPDPKLNFTRAGSPKKFSSSPVRFVALLPLRLERDTHVVVVAAGQQSQLGVVAGPLGAEKMPIAVSNPIFVDVDEEGFQANGDSLGLALPEGFAPAETPHLGEPRGSAPARK